jgi:hypothetical protein
LSLPAIIVIQFPTNLVTLTNFPVEEDKAAAKFSIQLLKCLLVASHVWL